MEKKYLSNRIRDHANNNRYQVYENSEEFLNKTLDLGNDSNEHNLNKSQFSSMNYLSTLTQNDLPN